MSPSTEERDFQKGRWRDVAIRQKLLQAVRSWRRDRGGPKTVRFAGIAMEQLDNRQLLSVNFTGVVPNDFPTTKVPGVVTLLPDFTNPLTSEPQFADDTQGQQLQSLIKVSGFYIKDIRVTYTPFDDTLSFGIDQPQSINQPGNQCHRRRFRQQWEFGNCEPRRSGRRSIVYRDPFDWGGTKSMGVFLNFATPGARPPRLPRDSASIQPSDGETKVYQVL